MPEDKLKINILGGLEIEYKDKSIGYENSLGKSKKMWVLFEYLVINYDRNIPQAELIDMLWPNEEVVNPANSLKVLTFKLRQELDRLEYLRGKDIILCVHGAYSFNEKIPHEIDVLKFESIISMSRVSDLTDDRRLELLLSALKYFKGSVLADLNKEPWAASLQTHYNEMYKNAVRKACEIMMDKGMYEDVIEVCKEALLIQPYEENNYYFTVRAYAAQENYSAAAEMYNQVKIIMQKEYGTTPDRKFEGAYKEIMKNCPKKNMTIDQLRDELEEETNYLTSFNVEYGEFKQIYRFVARRLERLTNGAYMCVYTLGMRKGSDITQEENAENVKVLEEALSFTLRQGDVFTRVMPNQFAVIFIDITEENAYLISNRVATYFKKNKKSDDFGIIHSMIEIKPSAFEKKSGN